MTFIKNSDIVKYERMLYGMWSRNILRSTETAVMFISNIKLDDRYLPMGILFPKIEVS